MLKVRITYDIVVFNEIIIEPSTLRYPTPALITISFRFSIACIFWNIILWKSSFKEIKTTPRFPRLVHFLQFPVKDFL